MKKSFVLRKKTPGCRNRIFLKQDVDGMIISTHETVTGWTKIQGYTRMSYRWSRLWATEAHEYRIYGKSYYHIRFICLQHTLRANANRNPLQGLHVLADDLHHNQRVFKRGAHAYTQTKKPKTNVLRSFSETHTNEYTNPKYK